MSQSGDKDPYASPTPTDGDSADSDPSNANPMAKPGEGKLIVLSTFDNSIDAQMFKNELEANGIDAKVANETTTAIFGATIAGASSAFWIEVLVHESDVERALPIKNNWNDPNAIDDEPIPEWLCNCGETVDEGFAVCWNCEAEYVPSTGAGEHA